MAEVYRNLFKVTDELQAFTQILLGHNKILVLKSEVEEIVVEIKILSSLITIRCDLDFYYRYLFDVPKFSVKNTNYIDYIHVRNTTLVSFVGVDEIILEDVDQVYIYNAKYVKILGKSNPAMRDIRNVKNISS